MEGGIGQNHIIAIAIDEQDVFILDLRMPPGNTGIFEILLFRPIVEFYIFDSILLLLPLLCYQRQDLLMIRVLIIIIVILSIFIVILL